MNITTVYAAAAIGGYLLGSIPPSRMTMTPNGMEPSRYPPMAAAA